MADIDTTPVDQGGNEADSLETLEGPEDATTNNPVVEAGATRTSPTSETTTPTPESSPKKDRRFKGPFQRLNVYAVLFGFVVVLACSIVLIAYLQNRQAPKKANQALTQSLSQSTLNQLATSNATVGSNQSVLNVQSSAVFAGQVLLRQNLEVAGNIQVGGTLNLNNITVAGTSQLGQLTVNKDLSVAGNTAIQGTATVAKSLQVNGNGTFNGPLSAPQITTSSLQLNGDLTLTHHIIADGATPGRSGGPGLGSGGSASVSGSDTAGSIAINIGSGPPAGCFVTVNFTAKYNATPHVLVTPVGAGAGGLSYYVDRSASSFSVCDATPPPAGSSFGFDYFVVD